MQDLGSLLAEYYGTDEEAVARRLAETQSASQLTSLPSGPLARSSVSSLESLHGSLQDMGSGSYMSCNLLRTKRSLPPVRLAGRWVYSFCNLLRAWTYVGGDACSRGLSGLS